MIKRFLSIAAIWVIVANLAVCNAEDERKNLIYPISSFERGLNQKSSPFSIPNNQGTVCENIRFNTEFGSLSKRNNLNLYGTADATDPILGMHRFYQKDGSKVLLVNVGNTILKGTDSTGAFTNILTLTTGDRRWQWETWHDIAIGCDGYNQPVKYDGSSASATYLGSCLATDAGTGAGPDGTYTYKISYYTTSYEVLLNVPSNTITVVDNDITLTMIPIAPDSYGGESVIGRKVYRTETGGTAYKLLTNGTIANNTAVTLTDSDADGVLGAAYPVGDATYKPPLGKFVIINQDRLWFANDPSNNPSRAYYSESDSQDIFADDSYWDIRQDDGDEITFMKQVLGLLTFGKNNSISKLYTSDVPDNWELSDPLSFIGCQAPYTASNSAQGLIYLGRDGLYIFTGQYSKLISDVVTPEILNINSTDFENSWGVYHNNVYYLAYNSGDTDIGANDRVLVYDIISDAYSIDLLDVNCFATFNSGDDWGILYMGTSSTGKVYSYSQPDYQILHRRHSNFTGLWDDMRYIPTNVGGDSENPILEIARTETISELPGTISTLIGTIARQDTKGNYTSQPISINAQNFDKLYWNEKIPLTGGNVTIKLRMSATGENNAILNDCFEFWDNYLYEPNDWTGASTSTTVVACQSDTTTTYRNDYSVRVNTEATITQVLLDSSDYAGKNVTFNAWVNSGNTVSDKVYIELDDGYSTSRSYYTNGAAWEETATTLAVNSTATTITLKCAVLNGADAPAYFDKVMAIEGSSATNDWTAWSSAYTDPSGSDISGETTSNYLQYLIEMETDDLTDSPNLLYRDGYVVKITYDREGEAVTTSIPIKWQSGWLDFDASGYTKVLRKIYVYHEGTAGTLSVKVDTLQGDSDTFDINLTNNPTYYTEYFTNGALTGEWFKVTMTNNDENPLKIKRILILYDVNPIY